MCFNSQSGILLDVMLSSSNSRGVGILCRDQFSRTLEELFCVGWNSRNARSLLVSSVEKANVSTYQHDAAAQFIPSLRTARRAEDGRKSFSLVLGTQLCLWFIDTLMGQVSNLSFS